MINVIPASETSRWREALARFKALDPTFLPEYHSAYSLRITGSQALLWTYEDSGELFIYPFLFTPVIIDGKEIIYNDISGIYGYTGPIATTADTHFIAFAWSMFDRWAAERKVIAEFVRFSPVGHTERFAHPDCVVIENRQLAVSDLPPSEEDFLNRLGPKTRNMLRKATTNGLRAREVAVESGIAEFRKLYDGTMARNGATEFFHYNDAYYTELLRLAPNELRLFSTFAGEDMVAASMVVVHRQAALYHLGASIPDFARLGAGNLSLFDMSKSLLADGVQFINMTGGRTTSLDDPLLKFKRSNATGLMPFMIGKRVIDSVAYVAVSDAWSKATGQTPDPAKIIFWRP